ncbi:MAG: acyl--CoA ligase [Proteobacteria bacterium]|nr:acyl--CoA ligase [Pseudomonadota bacterium]MBS0571897.1 acyl--CoA ligase [Pseudomonadota bacterium]
MLSEVRSAPGPACPAPFNLAAHVLAEAGAQPDRVALRILHDGGTESRTFGEIEASVLAFAAALRAMDLAPGARILLRLGNSVAFPLAFLGAVAAGCLPVACPAALTIPEITGLARALAPALIVAEPGLSLPDACPAPVLTAEALLALPPGPADGYEMGDPGRPAYLVYTSGTSGRPRAVLHAHRAIWARRMMQAGWSGLGRDDRLLHAGAFNWTFTLGTGLFDPWTAGATALVPAPGTAPADLPELLRRHEVTIFAAAPAVYRQMLKSAPFPPLPALRHGLTAGEKLSEPIRAGWARATGRPLHEAYGLSECSTFISSSPARPAPPGLTGHAQPGRRVAVLSPDGRPVPRGQGGVLAVDRRDPGLFLGYFGAEAETDSRMSGDWFLTGDMADMDGDGAIRILGRADDMMNAGGFRVSPDEVEAALALCPGAGEVGVVEVALGPGKSIIVACYTGPAAPGALQAHAGTHLARYKQPRRYDRVAALPHTANGKLNRRALRELCRIDT